MPKEQAIDCGSANRQPQKRKPVSRSLRTRSKHSSVNPPDKSNARLMVTRALRFHRESGWRKCCGEAALPS
jgi:hypothetical protein